MPFLRQLDTSRKLYASFAILMGLSVALVLWMLGQLGSMSALMARPDQKLSVAQASYMSVRAWTWIFIAVTSGAAGALALWLRAELARPLNEAAELAHRVASGDLSTRIDSTGAGEGATLLAKLQEMNDKLAGMIIKVRSGTEGIARNAGDIAAGSMELSAQAEEQGVTLAHLASAQARLDAGAKHNTERAQRASKAAASALHMAAECGAMVAEVAATMATMNASSCRIEHIVGVLEGIACRITALALTASVEAAPDGAQGLGLAALANEVRDLAQRCAAAAGDIRLLIESSAGQARAGSALAARAGVTLQEAVLGVREVGGMLGEIAAASAGCSADIEQVNLGMTALHQASRRNATLVERSAAAAASMRDQAGSLSRATAAFSLGKNYAAPTPAIHLVSSNPRKMVRVTPERRARLVSMHTMVSKAGPMGIAALPGNAAPLRSRGSAARRDLDWEKF